MKNSKGFTIVEIITVLVIITLIATMAIAGISGARGRIDNRAYNSKVKLIEQAAREYAKENSEKIKEEYGECTETSGHCDCSGDKCVYKFNTTVEELIELGYYDPEDNDECLVTNPRDKSKCFDKEPIEIIIDADQKDVDAHFGEEFDPYDTISPENKLCDLIVEGTEGTNGWYIGENNKLILVFKKEGVTPVKYGISKSSEKWYNDLREMPLSSTTGSTYYGYVKYEDGTEGSCVIKNIKVDATNPTDPNIEITDDFYLAFSGSRDTYSERVKYSYKIGEAQPVVNPKYKITNDLTDATVKVHSFDYAGNISNEISRKLIIENPVSGTVTTVKTYYCSDGFTCNTTPCKSTSKCIKREEKETTETKKYKCDVTNEIFDNYADAEKNCSIYESGTITVSSKYTCNDGYTCNTNPCKSTSKCVKTIEENVLSELKYKCEIDEKIYDNRSEAVENCSTTESGTVTRTSQYSCPTGYTCSDVPCKSTSTCRKVSGTTSPVNSTYYLCYVDGEYIGSFTTHDEAISKCQKKLSGEITVNYKYQCPSGFTCSDGANCNQNSTCIKTTTPTVVSTKYNCYINGVFVYSYDTEEDANNYCNESTSGTVESSYIYSCPTGYTCSGGTNCNKNSTCKMTVPVIKTNKYNCYIDGVWVDYYNTEEDALKYCNDSEYGTVTSFTKYYCENGYTCSDGANCNQNSTCSKTSTVSASQKTVYDCYFGNQLSGTYDDKTTATNNCQKTETGSIGTTNVYACPSGFTCSDNPCKSTSKCTKNTTANLVSTTTYSCPSGFTCSDSPCKSTSKCTATIITSGSYKYTSYCSITGYTYSWGNKLTSTNQTSCSEEHVNYDCKAGREGKKKTKCTHTNTRYFWQGACITGGERELTPKRYFSSKTDCINDMNNYVCGGDSSRLEFTDSCSSINYYRKETWTCNSSAVLTYGQYYCTGSCPASCPSGYTQSDSRTDCPDSSVKGKTCTSNTTCTSKSTRTCTKTTSPTATTKYSCPSGYTCSTNPCKSSSKCTKIELTAVTRTVAYTCSYNSKIYNTQQDAVNECKKTTSGSVVSKTVYACPSGYTCSDGTNCNSSSTCSKTESKQPLTATNWKCSLNDNVYETQSEAKSDCIANKPGIIQYTATYTCPSGFTCSGSTCKENSICTKQTKVYGSTKWKCSLDNEIYDNQTEAIDNCTKSTPGTINEVKTYGCPSGFTCSDGADCNQNSACSFSDSAKLYKTYTYKCSLNNDNYTSYSDAEDNCYTVKNGNVTTNVTYGCPSGYTCSDESSCNQNSTCTKYDEKDSTTNYKYYCSLTNSSYDTEEAARTACSRVIAGTVSNYYVYKCSSGYTCSDGANCNQNSTCKKTVSKSITSEKKYYCSLTDQYYDTFAKASEECSRYNYGSVLDIYVYTCDSPYTCSSSTCGISSKCIKETLGQLSYDTAHYCSIDTTIAYTDEIEAMDNCLNRCRAGKYKLDNKKCYILE